MKLGRPTFSGWEYKEEGKETIIHKPTMHGWLIGTESEFKALEDAKRPTDEEINKYYGNEMFVWACIMTAIVFGALGWVASLYF